MNTILTKEESKKILDSRRDGILCIPEGISVITQESLQLFTGQDNPDLRHPKYYFTKIIVPSSVVLIEPFVLSPYVNDDTEDCAVFKSIEVHHDNPVYCTVDNILYTKDMKTLVRFPAGKYQKDFHVPEGVETIAPCAFADNVFLKRIFCPASLTTIGNYAFEGCCILSEIHISRCTHIEDEAFQCAQSLKRLYLPNSPVYVDDGQILNCNRIIIIPDDFGGFSYNPHKDHDAYNYWGTPLFIFQNNIAIQEYCETYRHEYFSGYTIDENGIIWTADKKILIDFPEYWEGDTYYIPPQVTGIQRYAFNHTNVSSVITNKPLKIVGRSNPYYRSTIEEIMISQDKMISPVIPFDSSESPFSKGNNENSSYVFFSYNSADRAQANQIKNILETNGISCWIAPESIESGSDYATSIPCAIGECSVFLLLLSANSQKSIWVKKELDTAINLEKKIIPFQIDSADLVAPFNFYLSNIQRIEAYNHISDSLEELVSLIRRMM